MEGLDLVECNLKREEDIVNILNECFQKQQYYQIKRFEYVKQALKQPLGEVEVDDVLVTINPWTSFDLAQQEAEKFLQLTKTWKDKNRLLPPNPCSIAEKVIRNGTDGVIIPLGESGSGKSNNIRMILNYLSIRLNAQEVLSKNEILAINEILDLFCNAQTLICNNSTRCLQVYEVFFDSKQHKLLGVHVNISVLETFRVVNQIKGEGNFNIFHCLLNGLNSQQLHEYCLDMEHRFVPSLSGKHRFEAGDTNLSQSLKCLETIGFHEKEIEDMLHFLSAIILLGDLQFGKSSKRDVLSFRNGEVLEEAANLLGIPSTTLAAMIITKSKNVRGEKLNVSESCSKALYECDRLAVNCYETFVMFIETKINAKYTGHSRLQSDFSLRLLDVFGWENYNICSFDQLRINTINEALQSVYNAIIFKTYQMELEDENIYLNEPSLRFDQPGAVPLLFKPKGILDIVHGNSDSNSSNDQKLLKKLESSFKKEPRYITNNNQEIKGFMIEHFTGEVFYDITGFVARSRSWFDKNGLTCLKDSKNKVVSIMFQERISRENTSSEKHFPLVNSSSPTKSLVEKDWLKTMTFLPNFGKEKIKNYASLNKSSAAHLTMSLTSFLHGISSSKVYFIRCINSNLGMRANVFDEKRVLRQVKWSQLYETVKTRISSVKICFPLHEFTARYKLLLFDVSKVVCASPELCHSVLSKISDESQFKVGKTKVFMSRDLLSKLDTNLGKALHLIVLIQKIFRGILARKQYQNMIETRNNYDEQRSLFFSQMTAGISKFYDHLNLQINEDQRRRRQHKLKVSACLNFDETAESSTWCKILCFQRTKQMAEFSVKDPKVVIDGTNHSFTTDRIGFNSFPTPSGDNQMKNVKLHIGSGVELYLSKDGSLIAMRLCKNPIFVKGHFCEEKLLKTLSELHKKEECKVFDYQTFIQKINFECHPARIAMDSEDRCLAMCAVHLCFIKNSKNDEGAPCWVEIILTQAMQYVKNVISVSMERRREVQEKYHFKQPPALRIDSKMESTSVKMLQLIRPSRYIETVKFKRKGWARKRVVSNPFLYGEGSFSEDNGNDRVCSTDSYEETVFESNEEISKSSEKQEVYENVLIESKQDKRQRSQSEHSYASSHSSETENVETKWQNVFEISQVKKDNVSDNLNEDDENIKVKVENSSENDGENMYENVQKDLGNKENQKLCNVSAIVDKKDAVNGQNETKNINISEEICRGHHLQDHDNPMNDNEDFYVNVRKINVRENSAENRFDKSFQGNQMHSNDKNTLLNHTSGQRGIKEELYVNFKGKVQLRSNLSDESPMFSTPKNDSLNYTSVYSETNEREDDVDKASPPGIFSYTNNSLNLTTISTESDNYVQRNIPSPDYMDNDPSMFMNLLKQDEDVLKDKEVWKQEEQEVVYEVMNKTDNEEYYVNFSQKTKHQMSFSRFQP